MRVPLLDVTRGQEAVFAEMRDVFDRVLTSGRYILGPEVTGLEDECARYTGAAHAVGVSSGSDALLVVLMALGIGPGDEVIVPSYTFFATAGAVWRVGAKPVFVDCDPVTFNVTAELIEPALTERTRVVMPVHLFGQCCDMDPISAQAKERGIPVIEDAAQAIGARYDGRGAGSMGLAGCFSFYPTKNLGALGDAGLVTTNDAAFAHRLRVFLNHGMEPKYYHSDVGGNFRLDALQAALLRVKLADLDAAHAARRENAARYGAAFAAAGLTERVGLPEVVVGEHIFNQYVVRVPDRDAVRARLAEREIGTEIYYPVPLHRQECFASLGYGEGSLPESERAAAETLALPIFPGLREEEIHHVVAELGRALDSV